MSSLSLRIGAVAAVTLSVLQVAIGWASYAYVTYRCDRLLDSELRMQVDALRDTAQSTEPTSTPAQQEMRPRRADAGAEERKTESGFQYWGSDNRLRVSSPDLRNMALDALPPGFANITIGNRRWRMLTVLDDGRWIRVGQRSHVRDAIVRSAALQIVLLLGLGLPLLVVLIKLVIERGLAPIRSLAEQIARSVPGRSGPVGPGELPQEFEPIVASVNTLLARCSVGRKAYP